MLFWLELAIGYVVVMCPKKQNKEKRSSQERSRKYKEEEWEEDVTNMESCLKANKVRRKERREQARLVGKNRQYKAEERAQKKDLRDAMEKQHFLNTHKRLAETQH